MKLAIEKRRLPLVWGLPLAIASMKLAIENHRSFKREKHQERARRCLCRLE
jgi:hypothetical protein